MIYKAFIAQKVIALLLHEFFWVSYCKTLHQLNAAIYDFTLLRRFQLFGFSEQLKCTIFYVLKYSRFRW